MQANLAARRFDRAEALAREALARDPDQPRMVRLRAQALLKAGKAADANKLLEDGVAKQPEQPRVRGRPRRSLRRSEAHR